MSAPTSAKIRAEIAELGSRVVKTLVDADVARTNTEKDEKIRDLERQLAELKRGGK